MNRLTCEEVHSCIPVLFFVNVYQNGDQKENLPVTGAIKCHELN
jgi:hypothetical protein